MGPLELRHGLGPPRPWSTWASPRPGPGPRLGQGLLGPGQGLLGPVLGKGLLGHRVGLLRHGSVQRPLGLGMGPLCHSLGLGQLLVGLRLALSQLGRAARQGPSSLKGGGRVTQKLQFFKRCIQQVISFHLLDEILCFLAS